MDTERSGDELIGKARQMFDEGGASPSKADGPEVNRTWAEASRLLAQGHAANGNYSAATNALWGARNYYDQAGDLAEAQKMNRLSEEARDPHKKAVQRGDQSL